MLKNEREKCMFGYAREFSWWNYNRNDRKCEHIVFIFIKHNNEKQKENIKAHWTIVTDISEGNRTTPTNYCFIFSIFRLIEIQIGQNKNWKSMHLMNCEAPKPNNNVPRKMYLMKQIGLNKSTIWFTSYNLSIWQWIYCKYIFWHFFN